MKRLIKVLAVLALVLGEAFLILRTPDTDPAAMRAKYGGAPSQFVDLGGGLTVHLRDEGPRDAPAVVLLHGSNSDLHTWDAWAARLSGRYRIIRFDQIGHGLTGPNPAGQYTTADFAAVVGQVADKLHLGKFVLGGNSMGGGIALRYAIDHPDRLSALVLIDAAGSPVIAKEPGNIGFKLMQMPVLRGIARTITPRSLVEKSLRQSVSNQDIVTPAAVDRYWELLRYPGNRQATLDRFAVPRQPFAASSLRLIKVPTLILWGAQDRLIPRAAGEWLAKAIPASRLIVYPGIGHLPMEETADRSAQDLQAFLDRLPDRAQTTPG